MALFSTTTSRLSRFIPILRSQTNTLKQISRSDLVRPRSSSLVLLPFGAKTMSTSDTSCNGGDKTRSNGSSSQPKTAGLVIIGDEILKGQVIDTNSHYLAKKLYSMGVKLKKITVVGDYVDEIAEEVASFSKKFDAVFTTGGIGPTHDDLTYQGVARAFNEKVLQNLEMVEMIKRWLGGRGYSEEVVMRMAAMPASAKLLFDPKARTTSFPIVVVQNVYIFPGIPKFFEAMFPRLESHLMQLSSAIYNSKVFVNRDELSITPQLDQAVEKFKDSVTFGSYPVIGNTYYSTRLTLESSQQGQVEAAEEFLKKLLPENSVLDRYDDQPQVDAGDKVYELVENTQHPLNKVVSQSVKIIEEALDKYSNDSLWICFNGGKDCTVLLHLFYAVMAKKFPRNKNQETLNVLCISIEDPFLEMETFVQESVKRYGLNLKRFQGPILPGLSVALTKHPEIKAVLMGTRRSDPSGANLNYLQMTDESWPQIMRVSPILDWSYDQIWLFIRTLSLPYCTLYNEGYTSIGSRRNTTPNPALLRNGTKNGMKKIYKPAYELGNGNAERSGRC